MKLTTTWDDGKYVWEYFTDWFEAYQASRIGTLVIESTPNQVYRSRTGYSLDVFQTIQNDARTQCGTTMQTERR